MKLPSNLHLKLPAERSSSKKRNGGVDVVDMDQQTERPPRAAEPGKRAEDAAYAPLKLDPSFARAELSGLFELTLLAQHWHPSVRVFARTLLSGRRIDYDGNPLEDFSRQMFLDRFVFRNPKKRQTTPSSAPGAVLRAYRPRQLPAVRVDSEEFLQKERYAPDEAFYRRFFQRRAERRGQVGVDGEILGQSDDIKAQRREERVDIDDEEVDQFINSIEAMTADVDDDDEISAELSSKHPKRKKRSERRAKAAAVEEEAAVEQSDSESAADEQYNYDDLASEDFEDEHGDDDDAIARSERRALRPWTLSVEEQAAWARDVMEDDFGGGADGSGSDEDDDAKRKRAKQARPKKLKHMTVDDLYADADDVGGSSESDESRGNESVESAGDSDVELDSDGEPINSISSDDDDDDDDGEADEFEESEDEHFGVDADASSASDDAFAGTKRKRSKSDVSDVFADTTEFEEMLNPQLSAGQRKELEWSEKSSKSQVEIN